MSEEEKKAMKLIKDIEKNKQNCLMLECPVVKNNIKRQQKIIELKKELEHEKEKNKELLYKYKKNGRVLFTPEAIAEKCVSKDKIRDKIKEYDDMIQATYNDPTHQGDIRRDICREVKTILEELLEE